MLLILNAPRLRPKDAEQFYQVWRADAARFKALVSRIPVPEPPSPVIRVDKGKRKADTAFDAEDTISDYANGRASKRPTGESTSPKNSTPSFIGNFLHQAYQAFFPTDWTAPLPSEVKVNSPSWQYQQPDADALAYYLTRQGSAVQALLSSASSHLQTSPVPSQTAHHLPDSLSPIWEEQNLTVHALRASVCPSSNAVTNLELTVQSPSWMNDLTQPVQMVSFPSPAQSNAMGLTFFDDFNETLRSLVVNEPVPTDSTFDLGSAHPNDFLYTACMRLWPPNGREHDDLIPWTYTDYFLSLDLCDALTWFYASQFKELKVAVDPEGTETLVQVPFETNAHYRTGPEYRKVLPEAPLERVEGTARVAFPHAGGAVLLRRWGDRFKVPFVPYTWQFKPGDEESDNERISLPRILAYSADMKTACQPFDGRLGLAVPGVLGKRILLVMMEYETKWCVHSNIALVESSPTAFYIMQTFWDTLCHNVPREQSHLEFTIRLLHPHPIHETFSPTSASFVFFGSKPPVVYHHQGASYVPSFTPPIPILLSMHNEGKYDLWAVRLLSITLCVPPMCQFDLRNAVSSNWLELPIRMPHNGVRAILDTASTNTTLPPSVIEAMCSLWFQMDGLHTDVPLSHASMDKFADHQLLFTFAGAGAGEEIAFYCDATYFLGQLWENELFPGLLHWSHVRSSNDAQCDVAVLGQNFFWGAFVKFNAPYHGSPDSVPSIQLSPQRAIIAGQVVNGPWSFSFAE